MTDIIDAIGRNAEQIGGILVILGVFVWLIVSEIRKRENRE